MERRIITTIDSYYVHKGVWFYSVFLIDGKEEACGRRPLTMGQTWRVTIIRIGKSFTDVSKHREAGKCRKEPRLSRVVGPLSTELVSTAEPLADQHTPQSTIPPTSQ